MRFAFNNGQRQRLDQIPSFDNGGVEEIEEARENEGVCKASWRKVRKPKSSVGHPTSIQAETLVFRQGLFMYKLNDKISGGRFVDWLGNDR